MNRVLVNIDFKDAHTCELHKAGKEIELTDERVAEVMEVDKNMISVLESVKKPKKEPKKK